jgi:hypothetical protein
MKLGIRATVRQRPTHIVYFRAKLTYPFEYQSYQKYELHTPRCGRLDVDEVERFRKVLGGTIDTRVEYCEHHDSPVLYLPR